MISYKNGLKEWAFQNFESGRKGGFYENKDVQKMHSGYADLILDN